MKMTVEDNKIVFRAGAGGSTVRYSLAFVKNHIAKLEGELMKFREYERLLTTGAGEEIIMANLFVGKYKIEKADGSPVDPNAMYFVLRIDTDQHARIALRAYARSVRASDPEFANELDEWIERRPTGN